MNTDTMIPRHERPTPRTDGAFEAFHRKACGTAYIRYEMKELEQLLAEAQEINQKQAAQKVVLRRALQNLDNGVAAAFWTSHDGQTIVDGDPNDDDIPSVLRDPWLAAKTTLVTPPPPVVPLEDVRPLVEAAKTLKTAKGRYNTGIAYERFLEATNAFTAKHPL